MLKNKQDKWECSYCYKSYIRKNAYDKHILLCKFQYQMNQSRNVNDTGIDDTGIDDTDMNIPNISNKTLYLLLVDLTNKYNKLQTDYDNIKKYVVMQKRKINVLEYINDNIIINYDINFNQFIDIINKSICIVGYYDYNDKKDYNNLYLNYIFETNFIDGITRILLKIFADEREKNINIPIKAYKQKNEIYIIDNNNKWIPMSYELLKSFIIKIHKQIIYLFTLWQSSIQYKINDEHFNNIYISNMKKILGQSKIGISNNDIYLSIKNKLYKNISENLLIYHNFE